MKTTTVLSFALLMAMSMICSCNRVSEPEKNFVKDDTTSLSVKNPIVQTCFTADPAPMVHKGRVYVYTSHDEDSTVNNFFTMYEWRCYSSEDMVNWTDHGAVASLKNFKWMDRTNGAWAPHCIERNGKFYLYVPIHGEGIAVLVSDSPTGPFTDPIGKRLVESDHIWQDIDPMVAIYDGQAYLYWGNPNLWYVKLNKDMVSYDLGIGDKGIVSVDMTPEAFGSQKGPGDRVRTTYTEGPWLYKRNKTYYMVYASCGIPERISYSTSTSPEGPWTYRGVIMDRADHLAFTIHPAIIDFKGNSYFFYHDQALSKGQGFKRSVSVEQFDFNSDGSIPLISSTREGVKQALSVLKPFKKVEAETMAWSQGLKTGSDSLTGVYVTDINNGEFQLIRNVDFGRGAKVFQASLASDSDGGLIEIRLGHPEGELIGTLEVLNTGGRQQWKTLSCELKKIKGVHDLCFVFKGDEGALFNFDYWMFKRN